jgi:hypothetical protein
MFPIVSSSVDWHDLVGRQWRSGGPGSSPTLRWRNRRWRIATCSRSGLNMSEPIVTATIEMKRATVGVRQPAIHVRAGRRFFIGMSGALLLIVVMGFSRTLYLRAFFDVPQIPASVWLHGIVLTAWFAGSFLQTVWVAVHRIDIHRRLGWVVGGLGIAVLVISMAVTLNFVPRRRSLGVDIEAGMAGLSSIVWTDLSALLAFAIFLSTAVACRRRPEMHKRLMLLSSISIVQPAMNRIWRWPVFDGLDVTLSSLGAMLLLLFALGLYDVVSRKRVHAVTLLGGSFLMGSRIVSIFVIANSEVGQSFVRALAAGT